MHFSFRQVRSLIMKPQNKPLVLCMDQLYRHQLGKLSLSDYDFNRRYLCDPWSRYPKILRFYFRIMQLDASLTSHYFEGNSILLHIISMLFPMLIFMKQTQINCQLSMKLNFTLTSIMLRI